MSLLKRTTCPIGIDIGSHSIKMLQLEMSSGGHAVRAADMQALPDDLPDDPNDRLRAIAQMIRSMLAGGNFIGKQVVTCLPHEAITYKNLRLPPMPADELKTAVQWEAADRLSMNVDDVSLQYFDAGQVRQGEEMRQEVIMMAADARMIEDQLALLADCELQPVAIEALPASLARALGRQGDGAQNDEDHAATVILDVGYGSSKVLISRYGRVVFFKTINIGGKHLDEVVSQKLKLSQPEAAEFRRNLSQVEQGGEGEGQQLFGSTRRESFHRAVYEAMRGPGEDLARELGLCLRYYSVTFRGRRPDEVLVVGGESNDQYLAKIMTDNAGIQIEPGNPLAGLKVKSGMAAADEPSGQWAAAFGLSLRGEQRMAKRGAA